MTFSNLDLSVLKTILQNKKHALDFASDNDVKLFEPEVWNFANIVINYVKTFRDVPTKKIILDRLSKTNNKKLNDYIENIWSEIDKIEVDPKEYKYNLSKLKNRYAEKELLDLKNKISTLEPGNIDVNRQISDLQKVSENIKALNKTKAFEKLTLKESLGQFKEEYNAKLKDSSFDRGILTGYSYLDHVSDGLRPGELLLIGGESGGGKSMLLMNMAIQMWMQGNTIDMESGFEPGYDVLYFTLEMPFKPCLNRVLARMAGVPSKKIRNSKLNNEDLGKLKKTLKFIDNYPNQFEIIDMPRGATIQNIEMILEEAKNRFNPQIVVIDYLGLMDYDGNETEDWLRLGKISELCHELCRVHNIICLSAVQLNRAKPSKDQEEKIGLHRVGRSALILQNANIAIQINKRPNEDKYPDMEYYVIKCRDGELGKGRIIKDMKCASLIDDKIEINDNYQIEDTDDISDKLE